MMALATLIQLTSAIINDEIDDKVYDEDDDDDESDTDHCLGIVATLLRSRDSVCLVTSSDSLPTGLCQLQAMFIYDVTLAPHTATLYRHTHTTRIFIGLSLNQRTHRLGQTHLSSSNTNF